MPPWGKKKGDADSELDKKKSTLFGRKKDSTPASPAPSNPYAAAPPPNGNPYASQKANPYATANGKSDPYAAPSQPSFSQPPTSSFGNLSLSSEQGAPPAYRQNSGPPNRYEKSPVPQGGYGGGASRFPTGSNYGQAGGYGSDPYGGGSSGGPSRLGGGGYGGLGRSNSQDTMTTDAGRNALLGEAAERAERQPSPAPPPSADPSYSNAGGYESTEMPGGYAPELTAEEQEEEDVQATKSQINEIKKGTVQSTRNARRVAEQAEQTGRETLARLGGQGDRIHNTERNLDMASNHNRLAEEKARELRTLNRSMWAVHVANPFTKESRRKAAEEIELAKHQAERAQRDATTKAAYDSTARHQAQGRDLNGKAIRDNKSSKSLANRAKFQFEATSDDDEMEDEIDGNLDAIKGTVGLLNQVSDAMSKEIDSQNRHLDRITNKTDKVDDQIALNRHRLNQIR